MQQRVVGCISCQQRIAELETKVAQLVAQNEQLARESITDPLTGALNRRGFVATLRREKSRAERNGTPFCMAFLDLDAFKPVNDLYGHAVGDKVLQRVVYVLKRSCREIDSVVRLGGDEFGIILPETDLVQARIYIERLKRKIQQGLVVRTDAGVEVRVFASFGVEEFRVGSDLNQFQNDVDAALYRAKAESRQRAFTPDEKKIILEFLEIPVV
jgi:two-component system cell cycle response regulator